jgi:hypothetical protein
MLRFIFSPPGLILIGIIAVVLLVGVNKAPDKIQEKVDHRSGKKFKERRQHWAYAERMRQLRDEARRENQVFARWEKPKRRAQRMMNSPNPKRAIRGQRLMQDTDRWLKMDMRTVHQVAKSHGSHPATGNEQWKIRRGKGMR